MTTFNEAQIAQRGGSPPSTVLLDRAWFNPNLDSQWFIVPGIAGILTLLVSMLTTGLSVAREREMGTFDQLLVTPMRPVEILLGKALPGFLVGAIEASFIILVAIFWFDVPFTGSVIGLYLGLFCFLLAAVGIGLMISSLAVTQQQGLLGCVSLHGACHRSVRVCHADCKYASGGPVHHVHRSPAVFFDRFARQLFGRRPGSLLFWPQYWPLLIIGVVSMIMAGWLFRRRLS